MQKYFQLILFSFAVFISTAVSAADLEIDSPEGKKGETVTFTLSVNNAPNSVAAFGLDILFDASVLKYESYEKGSLVQSGFGFFDVNEVESGRVRVGGLDFGEHPVRQGGSGPLALLNFNVKSDGECKLRIVDLKDDLQNWTTSPGNFVTAYLPDPDPVDENNAPVATSFSQSLSEGETVNIDLNGEDADGDSLAFLLVSLPAHGELSGLPPVLTYAPAEDYSGPDSFTYKVSDGTDDSDVATVHITVNEISPELSLQITGQMLSLSWTPVIGADGYYLYYAPFPELSPIDYADMNDQTAFSAELPPGSAYYAAVQAYSDTGVMGLSEVLSFTIPPVLPAPELTVNTDNNTVSMSWSQVENAEGYRLYYAPYPSASAIYSADLEQASTLTAELPAGSAYYIAVKAYDGNGVSGFSNLEYFILDE